MEPKRPQTFTDDPAKMLESILVDRKLKNPSYSAAAFARDLGLSQAFVCQVLSGKRKLSLEQTLRIGNELGLIKQKGQRKNDAQDSAMEQIEYTLDHEKILKHWYHFAILEWVQMKKPQNEPQKIAHVLSISSVEAKTAISRLLKYGYLASEKDRLIKTKLPFFISSKGSSAALRSFHQSRLEASVRELQSYQEIDVVNRHFGTMFLPTHRDKIPGAKLLIEKFQKKLIYYLTTTETNAESNEVFQLSLQLFSAQSKTQPPTQTKN